MKNTILAIFLFISAVAANAQLTILGVPSADVTNNGGVYTRFDGKYQPSNASSTVTPNFMLGVGHRTELDLNAESLSHPGSGTIAIVPGFKTSVLTIYNAAAHFTDVTYVGDKFSLPVHNKTYEAGNYLYLGNAFATGHSRITAGLWNSQNYVDHGNKTGIFAGYEYTLGYRHDGWLNNDPKYVLAADWQSGNGNASKTTVGFMMFPTTKLMIIPAYYVGNSREVQGNHGATIYIGYKIK